MRQKKKRKKERERKDLSRNEEERECLTLFKVEVKSCFNYPNMHLLPTEKNERKMKKKREVSLELYACIYLGSLSSRDKEERGNNKK